MARRLTLLTFILTICLTSYGQITTETKNQELQQNDYNIDTSIIAVLPYDPSSYRFFKDRKPADLTNEDLLRIETILTKCINAYNKKGFTIDLNLYKRQYVAVLNPKGEKEVWVNCFCRTHDSNWKNKPVVVKDGGNCYFNLKINLTTGKYYELMVNGDA